nr:MAG: internal scaffolding protein [Microvirus sp.]
MTIFLRTPFNYDADVVSFQTGLDCSDDPSRAQQHMRDECDINVMVERFTRTGEIPQAPVVPHPVDFDEVFDFQSAMNVVVEAQRSFDALPAKVRARFSNDPGEFLAFVHDPASQEEARALGLLAPKAPVSEPAAVPPAPAPVPAPATE